MEKVSLEFIIIEFDFISLDVSQMILWSRETGEKEQMQFCNEEYRNNRERMG